MTPEEMDRTVQFIIESQARLAAAQEQDRQDRVKFEGWSKGLVAQIARTEERVALMLGNHSELLEHQSRRMDRIDKLYEDSVRQNADFQKQALHLLNLILDRLPLKREYPSG